MKLTYDPKHNIAYFRFHKKQQEVETIQLSEELSVDIAPDGTVYGVELLNANEQLRGEDQGKLIFVNAAKGDRKEISLN